MKPDAASDFSCCVAIECQMTTMLLNKYRKGAPLSERILKDILYRIRHAYLFFRNGFQTRTALFYPQYPSKRSITWKIVRHLRYNISDNPSRPYQLAINWEDETVRSDLSSLDTIAHTQQMLNINCRDIGKKHVDMIFTEVFGYSTQIDPLTYHGKCVQKSDANATHDGVVVECPVQQVKDGCIYQVLINNCANDSEVEDIRLPVCRDLTPFAYVKYRPRATRFRNANTRAALVEVRDVLGTEEVALLVQLRRKMGVDYGEIDILRNRDDGKIYVVDVNVTPWGPPNHLPKNDAKLAIERLAESFRNVFIA
jgi:hypothetical protein